MSDVFEYSREAIEAMNAERATLVAERDQAIKERDFERETSQRIASVSAKVFRQRDQALRLIRETSFVDVNRMCMLHDWARRASDPKQPWPTEAETAEILGGGG